MAAPEHLPTATRKDGSTSLLRRAEAGPSTPEPAAGPGWHRNVWTTLGVILLMEAGEWLWMGFAPLYLKALGAGAGVVAAYGALKNGLTVAYPFPGGWLADRLGRRAALTLFTLLAGVGYALCLVSPGWQGFLAALLLVMAWAGLALPALLAVVGDHLAPARRGLAFSLQTIVQRGPAMLTPLLGGWLLLWLGTTAGVRLALGLNTLLALAAVLLLRIGYAEATPAAAAPLSPRQAWRGLDSGLRRLLLAECLVRWAEEVPRVFIVLYLCEVLRRSPLEYSWLVGLRGLTEIACYTALAPLVDRIPRKPLVLLAFAFFALFPLALVGATGPFGLGLAFVVGGLRRLGEPARKALIVDLSGPDARGASVGLYYQLRGLALLSAPLVGGWLWGLGPRLPFYAATLVGAGGVLVYAVWGRQASSAVPRQDSVLRAPAAREPSPASPR